MEQKTLREVCDSIGVSRRAVQGYEKAHLVSASMRNERGYLLYDEASQERIRKIKLFQQLGFSIKEISEIIDAPDEELKSALEIKVVKLHRQRDAMKDLIAIANQMIDAL